MAPDDSPDVPLQSRVNVRRLRASREHGESSVFPVLDSRHGSRYIVSVTHRETWHRAVSDLYLVEGWV